ncbi:unnamed protein product, partial [Pleuronectes platessa]
QLPPYIFYYQSTESPLFTSTPTTPSTSHAATPPPGGAQDVAPLSLQAETNNLLWDFSAGAFSGAEPPVVFSCPAAEERKNLLMFPLLKSCKWLPARTGNPGDLTSFTFETHTHARIFV